MQDEVSVQVIFEFSRANWFRSATRRLGECGRTEVASGNDSFVIWD